MNSQGSCVADWKVQGAMVQTEMTVAVARARSWCALGVAVTAAAKAGSSRTRWWQPGFFWEGGI